MPGMVGIIRREPYEGIEQDLNLMVEAMRHEPYYVGNQYVNHDVGIHVGWLSHPRSLGECMPLVSSDKQHVLILVGEHFSHPAKTASSNGNGAPYFGAHELLRLYEEIGEKFISHLNGWFAGVLIDLSLRKATLFNDRYGMSRIYLYEGDDEFIFASEAKSLLKIRPALRSIDPAALAQFLRFNCVMGDQTLFKTVLLLPAASAWVFRGGTGPQKESYFSFTDWEEQPTLKREEFYNKFEETVSRVFPSYMEGEQPVALSLTAGLDTRAILASAGARNGRLPCYTFGGSWGEIFDIQTGRKLAAICNQPYDVIKLNERFLRDFPGYAQKSVYISDGSHDASGAHDVYFNKIARKIAPIRLTGKFGSEIVRIRRLIPSGDFPRSLLQSSFAPYLDEVSSFKQIGRGMHPLTRVVSKEIPWHEYGRVSVEQSETILRTPYMDNELVKLMYQAPAELRDSRDLQARYVIDKSQQLAAVPTNLGKIAYGNQLLSKATYIPLWVLFKIEYTYLYAAPHWLTWVDRRLEKLRPERLFSGRQKYEGYRIWLRTHFAEFVQDTLLNSQAYCTKFFDRAAMAKVVRGHIAGTHNYLNEINRILTVELACSTLLKP